MDVACLHFMTFHAVFLLFCFMRTSKGTSSVIDARGKSVSREVHDGVAYANFKGHKFSYLNITPLGTNLVRKSSECGTVCVNIPPCFSFNLATFPDINGKRSCELLPSDKYNNSDKFVASQFYHHFSIKTPCLSEPCRNNETCVSLYGNDSYVCLCKEEYKGKNCDIRLSFTSAILLDNEFYVSHLMQFLAPAAGSNPQWLLCFRASIHVSYDGEFANQFHDRCDGKPHTVTIAESGQYVFGGYTDIPWASSGGYGTTSQAFIFSLHNKEGLEPFKAMVKDPAKAIYRAPQHAISFGTGNDLKLIKGSDSSYARFGNSYSVPADVQDPDTILAGTLHFTPDEVEVFYLDV